MDFFSNRLATRELIFPEGTVCLPNQIFIASLRRENQIWYLSWTGGYFPFFLSYSADVNFRQGPWQAISMWIMPCASSAWTLSMTKSFFWSGSGSTFWVRRSKTTQLTSLLFIAPSYYFIFKRIPIGKATYNTYLKNFQFQFWKHLTEQQIR